MKAIESAVTKANEILVALEKVTDSFQSTEGLKLIDTRILKATFDTVVQAISIEQTGTAKKTRIRGPNKPKVEPTSQATAKVGVTKAGALTPTEAAKLAENEDVETDSDDSDEDEEKAGQLDIEKEVAKKKVTNGLSREEKSSKLGKSKTSTLFS